jgi:hypothetical protein
MKNIFVFLFVFVLFASIQTEFAHAQQSSSQTKKWARNFMLGAGYGYSYTTSVGITALNTQLGNSPLMQPTRLHGTSPTTSIWILSPDKDFNRFYTCGFSLLSDNVSAAGVSGSASSELSLWQAGCGLGVRIYPYTRGKFEAGKKNDPRRTRIRITDRMASFFKKFYVLASVNGEFASLSHNYALNVETTGTKIVYEQTATYLFLVPTARIFFFAGDLFHIFAEASYSVSYQLSRSVKIDELLVTGQDQRYRAAEHSIGKLVESSIGIGKASFGATLQF